MSGFAWPIGLADTGLDEAAGLLAAADLGADVAAGAGGGAGVSAGAGAEVFTPGSRSAGLGASCEGAAGWACCAQPQGATTNRAVTSNTLRMSASRLRGRSGRRRLRGFLIGGGLRCSRSLAGLARGCFRRCSR